MIEFSEFVLSRDKDDIFEFIDSLSEYSENKSVLRESIIRLYNNNQQIEKLWEEWDEKRKDENIFTDFGKGFIKGAKDKFKETSTDELVQKIVSVKNEFDAIVQLFHKKFHIDVVTAAILVSAGITGGLGAIPVSAIALALRKSGSFAVGKTYDSLWKQVTGKSLDEMDAEWRGEKLPQKKLAVENLTFQNFLYNIDINFLKQINEEEINNQTKSFATRAGEKIGGMAGTVAGYLAGFWKVIKMSLANIGKYIKENPYKTTKLVLAIIAGAMIGKFGTDQINRFLENPTPTEIQETIKATKSAGVPNPEEIENDFLHKAIGTYKKAFDAQIQAVDKSLPVAEKGYKILHGLGQIEKQTADTSSILRQFTGNKQ